MQNFKKNFGFNLLLIALAVAFVVGCTFAYLAYRGGASSALLLQRARIEQNALLRGHAFVAGAPAVSLNEDNVAKAADDVKALEAHLGSLRLAVAGNPELAIKGKPSANSAELSALLRESVDERRRGGVFERQPAHDAHDPQHAREPRGGVSLREVEQPLVVFHPLARLDHDRAPRAKRRDEPLPLVGQHGAIEHRVFLVGPGHPLGSCGIVKVDVRVDERGADCARRGLGLREDRRSRGPERASEQITAWDEIVHGLTFGAMDACPGMSHTRF